MNITKIVVLEPFDSSRFGASVVSRIKWYQTSLGHNRLPV